MQNSKCKMTPTVRFGESLRSRMTKEAGKFFKKGKNKSTYFRKQVDLFLISFISRAKTVKLRALPYKAKHG